MLLISLTLAILLSGCQKDPKSIDPDLQIPKVQIKKHSRTRMKYPNQWKKKISVSISSEMSVKEFIRELCSRFKLPIHISDVQDIAGISYSADNISLLKLIKNLCRLCKWRISITPAGDISILPDIDYFYTHEVAFLGSLRTMKSSSNINPVAQSDIEGSTMQFETENELNLWSEIENNLTFLLKNSKDRYSINKQGGMIIVNATQAEHEQIAEFLRKLHIKVASQVLIEARIIEVKLGDEYENGIDWDLVRLLPIAQNDGMTLFTNLLQGMKFLAKFGETRTLSNPRTAVLNNHHAMFKAVTNTVFFKLKSYSSPLNDHYANGNRNSQANHRNQHTIFTSERQITPIGIVFIVQPSIDFNNNTITLHVRPTISDLSGSVEDPAPSAMNSAVKSVAPVITEKSIDSVITVNSGEMAIVGGLITKKDTPAQFGINKGSAVWKLRNNYNQEIVMLVKATIIEPEINKELTYKACEILDPEGL